MRTEKQKVADFVRQMGRNVGALQPQIQTEHGSVISTAGPLTRAPTEEVAVAPAYLTNPFRKFYQFDCQRCRIGLRVASCWTCWTCPSCGAVSHEDAV